MSMSKQAMTVREVILEPEFDDVRRILQSYEERAYGVLPLEFWSLLSLKKQGYVHAGEQLKAKASWCLEAIGRIQDTFVTVFLRIGSDEFREAWEMLGYCEKETYWLDKHFAESEDEFGIEHIRNHAVQIEELFELRGGFSPGILHKEVRCSVCDAALTLRKGCEHEIGEIYDGERCHLVVSDALLLHVAVVDNPAQRYSFIWPENEGKTRFAVVKYLSEHLNSPWEKWSFRKEVRRRFHPAFQNVGRYDPCPCRSNLNYRDCCLRKELVPEFPHFSFEVSGDAKGDLGRKELNFK